MAQPNVVREPSMDEILASIRRIIESNDPVPPDMTTAMPEPEGFSGSAANDDLEDIPLTIDDAFAPSPAYAPAAEPASALMHDVYPAEHSVRPATEALTEAQPQRSLSLADVAARVRAASERNPGLRDMAPQMHSQTPSRAEEELAHVSSPLMTGRMAAAGGGRPADPVSVEPVSVEPVAVAPVAAPITPVWETVAPASALSAPVETFETKAVVEPEPMPDRDAQQIVAQVSPLAEAVSLISADAGQQVARSFQDLAVAIDQAERRSYDDIAAELLKPMLQDWLDENLPTLVERLVREEIERVARGNRR